MAKNNEEEKELTLEEAINAVKRLSNPDRPNEELELLKEASAKLLEEVQPGFEFEGDDDDGPDAGALKEELTKSPGFFEQMGTQISNVGVAGVIALSSAAYFQIDTVVEETRTVAAVAEEKWEEVKMEHPNINWDDPLAGFTTIIGVGDVKIDLDPPEPSGETPSGEKENSEVQEESEVKESQEPEPKAEQEQVKEKPKKKSGGLFKSLFGKDDEKSEEPEDEPREEPQQDDTIPDEQTEEETVTKPEAEATNGEVADGKPTAEPAEGTNVAESNGVEKKSSGGGLLSIFGFGNSEEEVVEDSEVSTDEEPKILVADSDMEAAKPPSEEPKVEVEVEPIDAMDDIKPHSMVGDEAFTDVEVKEPKVEVAEIEMDVDIKIEDILEMSEVAIEDVAIVDVGGDDIINDIDKVLTPIDGNVVSPVGGNINWADIFDPHNPNNSESDATPI